MDRKIEKKRWTKNRILTLIAISLGIIVLFFSVKAFNVKSFKIERSKLTVKKVIQGEFQDIILVDGEIEPIKMILVNTLIGGSVSEIFIEDGVMVKKGDPMVKLDNPTVMMNYMNQETAIIEQINNLRNLKLALEKDQRLLSESLIDSEFELSNKERLFKVDTQLYSKGVISDKEFTDNREAFNYRKKKFDFLLKNVEKTKKDNKIQIGQINNSINLMERNLRHIRENMDKLLVKSPVDGQISSFSPVVGESFSANQTIAKIDVLEGYKIQAQVDEYYLSTVKPGQKARFSFNGEMIELKVKKVIPEVITGFFKVELVFENEVPESITRGLSIQVRLELSESKQAILIPRGSYFQSSGGRFVFVIGEDGNATKRSIRVGRNNPGYYEVLEGLDEGEQIITSSYEAYKDYDIVEINK